MNIYQPYEELADTPDTLHLKLSDARERMMFLVYRAVPIALFFMVWYILQEAGSQIPMGFNYLFIALSCAFIFLLLFRSYITELKIAAGNIFMVQKGLTGVKEINVPVKDIDKVILSVRRGKGGGAKFILVTKNKRRFTIIRIPPMLMDDKHIALIAETLRQLLSVEITKA